MVKLPLLLSLIGGVARVDPSGTRIRGESHCLIIGDPGLGKSQVRALEHIRGKESHLG